MNRLDYHYDKNKKEAVLLVKFKDIFKNIKRNKSESPLDKKGLDAQDYATIFHMTGYFLLLCLRYGSVIALIIAIFAIMNRHAGYLVIIIIFGGIGWMIFSIFKFIYRKKKKKLSKTRTDEIIDEKINEFGQEISKKINYDLHYSLKEKKFLPEYQKKTIPLMQKQKYYRDAYKKIVELEETVKKQKPVEFKVYNHHIGFFEILKEKLGIEINYNDYDRLNLASSSFPSYIEGVRQEIAKSIKLFNQENNEIELMKKSLEKLSAEEDIVCLENIRFKSNGEIFETDFLLFSRYGIFALDVKGINRDDGYFIRLTSEGQWIKTLMNGKSESLNVKPNVLTKNVPIIESLFNQYERETGVSTPKIEPTIIIPISVLYFVNESELSVYDNVDFRKNLVSNEPKYDMNEMRKLAMWLEQYKLPEKELEVFSYVETLTRINEELISLANQYQKAMKLYSKVDLALSKEVSRKLKYSFFEKMAEKSEKARKKK